MLKWLAVIILTVSVFVIGLFTHSFWWFILSGIIFFGGTFIFDALECGTENEFLECVVQFIERHT
jgi:hypothetical protein